MSKPFKIENFGAGGDLDHLVRVTVGEGESAVYVSVTRDEYDHVHVAVVAGEDEEHVVLGIADAE